MRIGIAIGMGLLASSLAGSANAAEGQGHSGSAAWGYGPENGPEVWGKLSEDYALCAEGSRQSPINLMDYPALAAAPPVVFNHSPTGWRIDGHTVEVAATGANWIEVKGVRFELLQFHFHTPSEHTVRGKSFDMEIHFVHGNEEGALAVVGVLVQPGSDHPLLGVFAEHLVEPGRAKDLQYATIDVTDLLPREHRGFRYEGSLTTPPCSENVEWLVFETPIEASAADLATFETLLGKNNRPTQPRNERRPWLGSLLGD